MTMRSKKHLITAFITGFFGVASPCVTQALPSISSVSGTFTDGNIVTVSGSGFGANGPNVHFFDNFEGGTVGQPLKTGSGSAAVGQWNARTGCTAYVNTAQVSGNLAFQADQSCHWLNYGEILLPVPTTEVFYSWWKYISSQDKWPGEGTKDGVNWKNMWIMKSSPYDNDVWTPVLQDNGQNWVIGGNNLRNWGTGQRWISNSGDVQQQKGKWHRNWIWLKGDSGSTSTNGAFRYWVLGNNGVVLAGWGDNSNFLQTNGYWERLHVNAYGRTTANSRPTFDDIYIATGPHARARIEIGNQPDYNASTNIAISTPNLWSNTQVKFTFRKGSFTTGQTAYLFIFDANGTVNSQGFPIKLGGTSSGNSLTVPSNLQIQ